MAIHETNERSWSRARTTSVPLSAQSCNRAVEAVSCRYSNQMVVSPSAAPVRPSCSRRPPTARSSKGALAPVHVGGRVVLEPEIRAFRRPFRRQKCNVPAQPSRLLLKILKVVVGNSPEHPAIANKARVRNDADTADFFFFWRRCTAHHDQGHEAGRRNLLHAHRFPPLRPSLFLLRGSLTYEGQDLGHHEYDRDDPRPAWSTASRRRAASSRGRGGRRLRCFFVAGLGSGAAEEEHDGSRPLNHDAL